VAKISQNVGKRASNFEKGSSPVESSTGGKKGETGGSGRYHALERTDESEDMELGLHKME